jgi:hypothetical protein
MRGISLLLIGAALGSCSTTANQPMRSAEAQDKYQALLAGKAAGAPVSCIPPQRANDMVVIDENTVIFKSPGGSRVYVANMHGGCSNIGRFNYTMVTRQVGSAGLCRGDIADIVEPSSGALVGSCSFGDFTPYAKAGS